MKHFFKVLDYVEPKQASIIELIFTPQIARLRELDADFQEYFRKVDYRFVHEPKGKEQTTWMRAVKRIIGDAESKS